MLTGRRRFADRLHAFAKKTPQSYLKDFSNNKFQSLSKFLTDRQKARLARLRKPLSRTGKGLAFAQAPTPTEES